MIVGKVGELATEHEAPFSQVERIVGLEAAGDILNAAGNLGEHEKYPFLGCCQLVLKDPNDGGHCWLF